MLGRIKSNHGMAERFLTFFSFLNSVQHEKGSSVDKLKLKHSPLKKIPKLVIVELGLSQNIKSVGIEKGFLGV